MRKTLTERNSKILLWTGVALFLGGIAIFIYKEDLGFSSKVNATKIAQFGDFVGGVAGALWSLAGVILFYVALTDQRKDIEINRETLKTQVSALNQQIEEFKLQTEELAETRKVFQEQSETLKIQRFENTFFQLVSLHHELVDKLNFSHTSYSGHLALEKRAVLTQAMKDLKVKLEYSNKIRGKNKTGEVTYTEDLPKTIKIARDRIYSSYEEFYFEDYKQILSHYYRSVYHIFKFLYKSELIEKSKKQFYASILRAQLSSDELFLILYNAIQKGLGYPNFLFLMKEFDIMQNFDFRIIEDFPFHKKIYEQKMKTVKPTF